MSRPQLLPALTGRRRTLARIALILLSFWLVYRYYLRVPAVATFASSPHPAALKVLFVGNSLTYFHDMPGMLVGLLHARTPDLPVKVSMVFGPGLALWDHLRSGVVQRVLRDQGPWDWVVLQEKGGLPSSDPEGVERNLRELATMAASAGARPLVFVDWCDPDAGVDGSPRLASIAELAGVRSVPLHRVWLAAIKTCPSIPLIADDGFHPSLLGSYLDACAFFTEFTRTSPAGLPVVFAHPGRDGASVLKDVDCLPREMLAKIHAATWRAVTEWQPTTR